MAVVVDYKTASGVSGGAVTWNSTTTFQLGGTDSNELHKVDAATTIIAHNISTLNFTRASTSPDIVHVDLIATKSSMRGHSLSVPLDFEVQMRNK